MDAQEFKHIFLPYSNDLYRAALRLTGNAPDAEDLVQELYLKLWLKRNELDSRRQNLQYLSAMLRNLFADSARSARPSPEMPPPESADPETRLIDSERAHAVSRLLGSLSERERTVIRLHVEEEMNYREMHRATGLSEANLRVIMNRTKQKLRKQFLNLSQSWKK